MAIVKAGDAFGTFVVEKRDGLSKSGHPLWRCTCGCGNVRRLAGHHLVKGYQPTCPCHREAGAAPTAEAIAMFEDLKACLSKITGLDPAEFDSRSKAPLLLAARAIIVHEMVRSRLSLWKIGAAMKREHTTILRIARRRNPYEELATLMQIRSVEDLRIAIEQRAERHGAAVGLKPDTDRGRYDKAVQKLKDLPEEARQPVWSEICKTLYPNSWLKQAAMLPRGVQGEPSAQPSI
jgi:hypothetical protein